MDRKLPPNFLETLSRMYQDAKILYGEEEYYNCCYLSGYVLECALKYILCTFGVKSDGTRYTVDDVKGYQHGTEKLNQELEQCISGNETFPNIYRLSPETICPFIFKGSGGYPPWNPKYRYGEHPKWSEKEWGDHYIAEIEQIFRFIASIAVGE